MRRDTARRRTSLRRRLLSPPMTIAPLSWIATPVATSKLERHIRRHLAVTAEGRVEVPRRSVSSHGESRSHIRSRVRRAGRHDLAIRLQGDVPCEVISRREVRDRLPVAVKLESELPSALKRHTRSCPPDAANGAELSRSCRRLDPRRRTRRPIPATSCASTFPSPPRTRVELAFRRVPEQGDALVGPERLATPLTPRSSRRPAGRHPTPSRHRREVRDDLAVVAEPRVQGAVVVVTDRRERAADGPGSADGHDLAVRLDQTPHAWSHCEVRFVMTLAVPAERGVERAVGVVSGEPVASSAAADPPAATIFSSCWIASALMMSAPSVIRVTTLPSPPNAVSRVPSVVYRASAKLAPSAHAAGGDDLPVRLQRHVPDEVVRVRSPSSTFPSPLKVVSSVPACASTGAAPVSQRSVVMMPTTDPRVTICAPPQTARPYAGTGDLANGPPGEEELEGVALKRKNAPVAPDADGPGRALRILRRLLSRQPRSRGR